MVSQVPVGRSFTHTGQGTPASVWRRDERWGSAESLTLDGVRRLVVVVAHPDDESLGAGALVSTAVRAGLDVDLVVATAGEGSHPDSPTHTPRELEVLRSQEAVAAAAALGVHDDARLHLLRLPDGGVADHQSGLTTTLVDLVGDGRGTLLVAPWRHDGHPDHEAVGRAAAAAARRTGADLWEFPVWFWHWARPDEAPWDLLRPYAVDVAGERAKAAAISAHASQVGPLSGSAGDEPVLSAELLAHFEGGHETFVATPSQDCTDDALDELHQDSADPWGTETRWYERRKRELVLAMLPRHRFERALEVGCSAGALAEALARRCGEVVAVDRAPAALELARQRFTDVPHVRVRDRDIPHEWPDPDKDGTFDLVVVSEVGYFLSPGALERLVERVAGSLREDGVLVLCHWRHPVEGWVLDARSVHEHFAAVGPVPVAATYRDRDVEIQVLCAESAWLDPETDHSR